MYYEFYDYFKNKYFDALKDMPPVTREAEIFRITMEEIPISIKDTDVLAGRYGTDKYSDEYGYAENRNFEYFDAFSPKERHEAEEFIRLFGTNNIVDRRGHTCIDYGKIINEGLIFYIGKVEKELKKECTSEEKRLSLEAMLISLKAVGSFTARFAALAEEESEKTDSPERKAELLKIKEAMLRVPMYPARNFYEAVSAVWIMHAAIPLADHAWWSISLGRTDSYLYPMYLKALDDGVTEDEMKAYLKNFFIYLNTYGDGACALNIGGLSADGEDEINPLSRLLIEVEKEVALASPIFVARLNPKTPEDVIDSLIDLKLFSIGQPTFYGELNCRRALMNRGLSEDEAKSFSVSSCMGIFKPGDEIAHMWGSIFNSHLPLELAVNGGKPIFHPLPFELKEETKREAPTCLEELLESYSYYIRKLFEVSFEQNRKNAKNFAVNLPNPLLSSLTNGCVESGIDRALGAKYNTETIETVALMNTGNAICAIDTLVFEQKKYSMEYYIEAVRADFVGYEQIHKDILSCEKYGTNSEKADSICRRLCEIVAKHCKELSEGNVYYLPSLHTITINVTFGYTLYTTLDGRMKGTPVNKNAGPTNEVRTPDPTSLVISAASIKQELFTGGQPIDVYFDRSLLNTKEKRDDIKALVKTYFDLGGLQFNVNSIDIAKLEEAHKDPAAHPELIVRLGGYSTNFMNIEPGTREEFIERFKKEKGV
ncbi:MAG: hypothetical protein E7623_05360 [Ruminococcaceae bacterium]|nr:hypothetical protein [Oscillospiraceae bacterium]